jgi:hypothetical protein
MSNHSAETPEGVLDHNTLKSFYGVSGAGNNLTYQKGYEVSSVTLWFDIELTMLLNG